MNLEEARAALLALPGVFRVDVCQHTSDPITVTKLKVYTTDPPLSHEELQQSMEELLEIKESLELTLSRPVDIEGIGPRS